MKKKRYIVHWNEKLVFAQVVEAETKAEARTIALEEVYGLGAETVVHVERGYRDAQVGDEVHDAATHASLNDFEVTEIIP